MKRRRQAPRGWETSKAELGTDDGTDPRAFHDKPWNRPPSATRKTSQLCGQVLEALHGILSGMADDRLQNLAVVKVEPAPNTGRLRVTVAGFTPADATDPTTRTNAMLAFAEGRWVVAAGNRAGDPSQIRPGVGLPPRLTSLNFNAAQPFGAPHFRLRLDSLLEEAEKIRGASRAPIPHDGSRYHSGSRP